MIRFFLKLVSFISLLTLVACSNNLQALDNGRVAKTMNDGHSKISVKLDTIDSTKVILTNIEITNYLDKKERKLLFENLAGAQYDSKWNKKDIMIKMVAPDFILMIGYKGLPKDKDDRLMVWKKSGKVKFHDVWYNLPEKEMNNIAQLLIY